MSARQRLACPAFREGVTDYLETALPAEEHAEFDRHAAACRTCRRLLAEIGFCREALAGLRRREVAPETEARLVARFREWRESCGSAESRASGRSVETLLAELLELPPPRRLMRLRNSRRYHSPELCELLLEQGYAQGWRNPEEGLDLIETGALVAQILNGEAGAAGRFAGLMARSEALRGNVRRVLSDFSGAARAFRTAAVYLDSPSVQPLERAVVLDLEAAFLGQLSRFDQALELFDQALTILKEAGDSHLVGKSLISKASVLFEKGDVEGAISTLQEARGLIDTEKDERLLYCIKHNLLVYLCSAGRSDEAEQLLADTARMHRYLGNVVDQARFRWLEGQIALEQGNLETAETAFLDVKRFFVDKGIAYDVALVSLDLASVYVKQGRVGELKKLAGETLTLFQALDTRREAIAAMIFFQKAVQIEQATIGLFHDLRELLDRARREAGHRAGLSVVD
jgi:tetratricopeptide (TPR) repeat protein